MKPVTRISHSLYPACGSPRGSVAVASCEQSPLAEGLSRAYAIAARDNKRGSCEHLCSLRQNESNLLWRPRFSAVRFVVATSRTNRLQLSRLIPCKIAYVRLGSFAGVVRSQLATKISGACRGRC